MSRQLSKLSRQALSQKGPPKCPRRTRAERQLWRQLGNANVATMLRKGQSKRGHTLVGFHAAAASPAPQPMKKLRAGSSHVDPPLRIGQSASPAVQSGTHAAPTTAASGRARPNALAAPSRRPFASPPNRPPSSATDAANTALLADHATAAAVAAPIRVAGARGLASSQSGGRSSRPDQAASRFDRGRGG